jgi:protocatechuate 3,4-dioxygenase beta subunit
MLAALAASGCNDGGATEDKTISEPRKNAGGRLGDLAEALTGKRLGLGATGEIKGKVFDREGTPLYKARVLVKDIGLTAITDADGNFEFRDLQPGRYSLKASRKDCVRQTVGAILVGPGCTTLLSFRLGYQGELISKGMQPDYPSEGIKRPEDAIRVNPSAGRK